MVVCLEIRRYLKGKQDTDGLLTVQKFAWLLNLAGRDLLCFALIIALPGTVKSRLQRPGAEQPDVR
jgi:hypothetical protein